MIRPCRSLLVAFALLTPGLSLTPCSASPAVGGVPTSSLRCMTYNVKGPGWNPDRLAQVVSAIEAEQPDVLALEEANPATNGVQLVAALADEYDVYLSTSSNPIFLRQAASLSVLGMGIHDLPACTTLGSNELTWLQLASPEGALVDVYAAHLCVSSTPQGGGDPLGNQAQAASAATFIAGNTAAGTPYVLMGDLNANQSSPTIAFLTLGTPLTINGQPVTNPLDLDDTWGLAPGNNGTHPGTTANGGQTALDWILAGPDVTVSAAEVITFVIPPGQEDGFSDHLPVTATLEFMPDPGPWTDVGGGTLGVAGAPNLVGTGTLVGGTPIDLALTNAAPGALLLLWISLASTPVAVFGGTLHAFPFDDQVLLAADGSGQFAGGTIWPAAIPMGTNVWFQFLLEDASVVYGISLSNAVLGTTP